MKHIIIYPNENGWLTFVNPAAECGLSVEEIARKDVPAGKPYLLVPIEFAPVDHTFFNAFEADFSNPDGYGIGHEAWFAEQAGKEASK